MRWKPGLDAFIIPEGRKRQAASTCRYLIAPYGPNKQERARQRNHGKCREYLLDGAKRLASRESAMGARAPTQRSGHAGPLREATQYLTVKA